MENKPLKKKIIISKSFEGLRLDHFLSEKSILPTRSQVLKLISKAKILVNKSSEKAGYLLKAGDVIEVFFPQEKKLQLSPYDFPVNILFEDEEILVVNKPAGLVVHPSFGHEDKSLVNVLFHKTKLSSGSDPLRPGIVHRLDKDVSGLLVLAKTKLAENYLIQQFKLRKIQREYWGISLHPPIPIKGKIESWITRHPVHRKKFISLKTFQKGSKKACSSYSLFKEHKSGLSWIKIHLQTGRTHQIRLHMNSISCSLVGDKLYGGQKIAFIKDSGIKEQIKNLNRIALHAQNLKFVHPVSSKSLSFQCPWPSDLKNLLKKIDFI